MTEYYIPTRASETEFVEKRSRFIGHVLPVETEEEARAFIDAMKKRYYDARHNCWCYLIREGGVVRYSDDGEPQGTAGQPMLGVFEKEGVTNLVCVVTRYFGGILLGAGGLVRAYSQGASVAVKAGGVSVMRPCVQGSVLCDYAQYGYVQPLIVASGGVVDDTVFADAVTLRFHLPELCWDKLGKDLTERSAGTLTCEAEGTAYYPFAE